MNVADRKTLQLDDGHAVIIRSKPPLIFHDVVTEARCVNGMAYVSLGSLSVDADNDCEVEIVSRHRMSIVSAQVLRDLLTTMINEANQPVDTSKAN